jgi:hypothetical protein
MSKTPVKDTNLNFVAVNTIAAELDVRPATVKAWNERGTNGFPKLIQISNRYFALRREIDAWKRRRFAEMA